MIYDHPYIKSRGVAVETAKEFGIYTSSDWRADGVREVFFQIHDPSGNYLGEAKRAIVSQYQTRYSFSGIEKSNCLYNYHRAKLAKRQAVIVVEGFFDACRVYQAGYHSVVALMGVSMSQRQEQLLLRWWEHIIFMLDGNQAGRNAQKDFIKRISKHSIKGVYGINLPDGIEPDMLEPNEVRKWITGAV